MSAIPPQAKKVFSGVIFDVYQWEQELYDGSTATFEKLKRPATLTVIPVIDGKIAIGYEEQPTKGPFLSLLGGRLETGEEPLSGAKRELLEEAGLESDEWELWNKTQPYTKIDWDIFVYIAKNCRDVGSTQHDPGEKIEVRMLDFDEFIEAVLSEQFYGREFTEKVLRMKLDPPKLQAFKKQILG